jgi:multidrug efflux pump
MLTAAAASLGLLPIAREIFWGPMAYAMMGGIIVGTVLTLLFLPAPYVAWFRIKEPENRPHLRLERSRFGGEPGSTTGLRWPKLTSSRWMVTDSPS